MTRESIFTGGTATVLDLPLMTEATDTDDGPFIRPLTEDEVRAWPLMAGPPMRLCW
ncbi:hypothetical protein JK359_28445 [Streptomyces actinomycinicus]|uniref:Uncharacterized protein n=1 Tax=Streptomyces actinomycinicus TaxID=1695166 RepID=A0A937EPM8_9ACTN|nr:hypothetical protein [Streptomyces actinomycinicus]MBL1085850.1 hypothetical protein [Streptomyces actinomycinicus]